jgi:hypothetical protein
MVHREIGAQGEKVRPVTLMLPEYSDAENEADFQ